MWPFSSYRTAILRSRLSRYLRLARWGLRLLIAFLLIDLGYILGLMPDWDTYENGPIRKSAFILDYVHQRARDPSLPALRWSPVSLPSISNHLVRAVIVAEDSRFYEHSGLDTEALKAAAEYNLTHYEIAYGGSTISQQLTKNLLLSPSRNPLRKWHELWLTLAMEQALSKKRILELYLNVVEFGRGVYGAEAAAQYYWGVRAKQLSLEQAIELAASLTSPVNHNPNTRTEYFLRQRDKIRRNLGL